MLLEGKKAESSRLSLWWPGLHANRATWFGSIHRLSSAIVEGSSSGDISLSGGSGGRMGFV